MNYLSVCSGIEAATCAWHPIGFNPVAFSEIEKFPSQVLEHHYPNTPNLGDMTKFKEWPDAAINILVGGTPCQSFSVAGLRKGLDDPRGNLMLTYLAIAARYRPEWLVWENVPGVLSSNGGRDFAALLRGMDELGYGWAYRVLDAQYFGVAQRRRRVFVVANASGWGRAAAVLFERHSLQGNPAPRREAGEVIAPKIRAGATNGSAGHGARSGDSKDELIVPVVNAYECGGIGSYSSSSSPLLKTGADLGNGCEALIAETFRMVAFGEYAADGTASSMKQRDYKDATDLVAHTLRGEGFDASEDGTGRGTPLVPVAFVQNTRDEVRLMNGDGAIVGALSSEPGMKQTCYVATVPAVCFEPGSIARNAGPSGESHLAPTLRKEMDDNQPAVRIGMQVRRLTPVECERLQGFSDGYTDIRLNGKQTPDGPRYKALGNSMAVPVMHWIGKRIAAVDAIKITKLEIAA